MKRDCCPICLCPDTRKPRLDLEPHPYFECTACGFYYQKELIAKVYEASHEVSGNLMSEADRQVNNQLARFLFDRVGMEHPRALDIGSKYPWLSHCLAQLGTSSYAIDGIPEILKFVAEERLNVNAYQCDFETTAPDRFPWGDLQFDLITLVHVAEHFYFPLKSLWNIRELLTPTGTLFIRCPDNETPGIERDFQPGYFEIHPQIWNLKSFQVACGKVGLSIQETYTFCGQRDLILTKSDNY